MGCTESSEPKTVSLNLEQEMALPAVQGSSLPKGVCGKDERVKVDPMTSPPYKWICRLLMESASGKKYVGSGFKIHLPDVDRTAIVTSGHRTYVDGAYATRITVTFPGQQAIVVGSEDIYASPEYIDKGNPDYDYGLILLPGRSDDGFGWSAIVDDEELNNLVLTNCGYPADKPPGTMWITGGNITSYATNRIYYMKDTMSGQSGSPVYTWYGGYWTVLGVHSYGGCPEYENSAARFTVQMISRFLERMNCLIKKSLNSVEFPNVYFRCDGTGVTRWGGPGGGTVNCQYSPPGDWEAFYIYPVEMTPSLAPKNIYKVVIQSADFKKVFIRMDSKGMNHFNVSGGGEVNCQYTAGAYEIFFVEGSDNPRWPVSFRSVQFPLCYIRLDGKGVHSKSDNGGGTVNCQWYDNIPSHAPGPYETFHVENY